MCGHPTLNGSHHAGGGPVVLDPPARFALYLTVPPAEHARPDQPDTDDELDEPNDAEVPDEGSDEDPDTAADALDTMNLADHMALVEHDHALDPERVVAWGLNIVGRVLVATCDGCIHRCASPESARALISRRLRRQLSLVYT